MPCMPIAGGRDPLVVLIIVNTHAAIMGPLINALHLVI